MLPIKRIPTSSFTFLIYASQRDYIFQRAHFQNLYCSRKYVSSFGCHRDVSTTSPALKELLVLLCVKASRWVHLASHACTSSYGFPLSVMHGCYVIYILSWEHFFPPAAINHSLTGGDVRSHKNIGRRFGADENWLPQVFLETSVDLQWSDEIFPCSSEMLSCLSRHSYHTLVPHHTQRVSLLHGLNPSGFISYHARHGSARSSSSAFTAAPQTHPTFFYLRDSAQALPPAWNTFPQVATQLTFFPPQVFKKCFPEHPPTYNLNCASLF